MLSSVKTLGFVVSTIHICFKIHVQYTLRMLMGENLSLASELNPDSSYISSKASLGKQISDMQMYFVVDMSMLSHLCQ